MASENDIGEDDGGDVIVFGVPFAMSPASPPVARDHPAAMQVEGAAAVAVGFRRRAPHWRPAATSLSGSSSELSISWAFLLLFASLLSQSVTWPAAPRARCASARADQSSRVGRRGHVSSEPRSSSHVCDIACSAVRRRVGSGWRTARMKFLAVM